MVISLFKDKSGIRAEVECLHNQAREARERGDYKAFYDYSKRALDMVNDWIDSQRVMNERSNELNLQKLAIWEKGQSFKVMKEQAV